MLWKQKSDTAKIFAAAAAAVVFLCIAMAPFTRGISLTILVAIAFAVMIGYLVYMLVTGHEDGML